jgi:hypothetical protein
LSTFGKAINKCSDYASFPAVLVGSPECRNMPIVNGSAIIDNILMKLKKDFLGFDVAKIDLC